MAVGVLCCTCMCRMYGVYQYGEGIACGNMLTCLVEAAASCCTVRCWRALDCQGRCMCKLSWTHDCVSELRYSVVST
jgi:hypothetical protein